MAAKEEFGPPPDATMPPAPRIGERPSDFADRIGVWYAAQKTADQRKAFGLYLTPAAVARFMAERIRIMDQPVRLLDPSAGAGILLCGAVEALAEQGQAPFRIQIVAYEVDHGLIKPLNAVLEYLKGWCADAHGVQLTIKSR